MSILKAEIKAAAAHEIGVRMDDALEAARGDISRADGSAAAATKISLEIDGLVSRAQKDIDAGAMGLEDGKLVVSWLQRAHGVAQAQALAGAQVKLMAQGRVSAFESVIGVVAKYKGEEEAKAKAIAAAVETGRVSLEDAGRPAPSLKAQRKAEEGAAPVKKTKGGRRAKNS